MDALAAIAAINATQALTGSPGAAARAILPDAPAAANEQTDTRLSQTAVLLEALQTQHDSPQTGVGSSAQMTALLTIAPSGDTASIAALASALARDVAASGLFYEAHLATWMHQDLPDSALQAEPQARATPLPVADVGAELPGKVLAGMPAMQGAAAAHAVQGATAAHAAQGATASGADPESFRLDRIVAPQLTHIVQQQLQAIDSGQIPWQGQVWPGQPLQMRIRAESTDPEDHRAGSNAPDTPWVSQLRLTLPSLGTVTAELQLQGKSCRLRLQVAPEQLTTLRSALPELAHALDNAGVPAQSLLIERSGKGGSLG